MVLNLKAEFWFCHLSGNPVTILWGQKVAETQWSKYSL